MTLSQTDLFSTPSLSVFATCNDKNCNTFFFFSHISHRQRKPLVFTGMLLKSALIYSCISEPAATKFFKIFKTKLEWRLIFDREFILEIYVMFLSRNLKSHSSSVKDKETLFRKVIDEKLRSFSS